MEISYSPEKRKNVVMSVTVDDLSAGSPSSNYSWNLGLSQKYSNLDIILGGHLGQSDNIDTFGSNIKYLTNQKQTKILNTFLEIKKLQKEIGFYVSVQFER